MAVYKQDFLPGLDSCMPRGAYLYIKVMFTWLVCHKAIPGQGVERKGTFSPPLCPWCLIGQVPSSQQGPMHGASPGRGGERGVHTVAGGTELAW